MMVASWSSRLAVTCELKHGSFPYLRPVRPDQS